jgi:hypothetical protein
VSEGFKARCVVSSKGLAQTVDGQTRGLRAEQALPQPEQDPGLLEVGIIGDALPPTSQNFLERSARGRPVFLEDVHPALLECEKRVSGKGGLQLAEQGQGAVVPLLSLVDHDQRESCTPV